MIRWLLLLVVLAGLAAGGWFGYQVWTQEQQQKQSMLQQQERLLQQLADQQKQLDVQLSAQQQLTENLSAMQFTLSKMQSGARDRWFVAEAAALAELAARRLVLTNDVEAALKLVMAADEVLSQVSDAGVLKLRKKLALDIQALETARQVDVHGMVLTLGGLRDAVPGLQALRPRTDSVKAVAADEQPVEGWEYLSALLGSVVQVRHHQDDVQLPLTQMQQKLIGLSLQNDLQQAQLALLNSQPEVFAAALQQSGKTLQKWFNSDDAGVIQMQQALKRMQHLSWDQAMPDLVSPAALSAYSSGQALTESHVEQQQGEQP